MENLQQPNCAAQPPCETNLPETPEAPETRVVNGAEYTVTAIPPVDPQEVRKADKIKPEPVGTRPMLFLTDDPAGPRKAPKHSYTQKD